MSDSVKRIRGLAWRTTFAALGLLAHTFIICVIIVCVAAIEHVFDRTIGLDTEVFDLFPLKYIFHLMDVALLVAFLALGAYETVKGFYFEHRDENGDDAA
ncbi:MAG: hypothetical protein AAFR16_10210 [Pseudomonadota bacterium]